jgi:GH3 auxin-responsive promoter
MIGALGGAALNATAAWRRRALERVWRRPAEVQERTLLRMVRAARDTEFGLAHDFDHIRGLEDYRARVPLRDYVELKPWLDRAAAAGAGITWSARATYWVKTSGTTAGDKAIPVTARALRSHRRGGWDALIMAAERVGGAALVGGPMLFLGGSTTLSPGPAGALVGDLSGVVARRMPRVVRGWYSPGEQIASIADWPTRLTAIARLVQDQDLRLLSGMPSWMLVLFESIARERQAAGRALRDLSQLWPRLRVFVHGGVSFAPYRGLFEEWMGRALEYVEVYPASEGFVALQTERSGGLTLMLDYGIAYEFIPVEDLGSARPRRHTVAEIEMGRAYAVALTTPAGLWSYLLGDTVRFIAADPLRLVITGRTRHYVNAFGENVIVEEVERALLAACAATGAEAAEFTVAPRFPSAVQTRGGHDWLVEFRIAPRDRAAFVERLDVELAALNTDYRTKRRGDVGMVAPRLVEIPRGGFHRWLASRGRLGDQHKVPRAMNTRALADALAALMPESVVSASPGGGLE